MKNYFIFSPDIITVNGHKYAAEYRIISASRVNITVNYPDCAPGCALIVVEKSDPRFFAVAAAARGEYPEIYITGADGPAQAADAPETFEAVPAADDPAQAANARKTFDFVGTEIALKYGRILFDAVADRTRVILENADAATIETVKAAGFYYSKVMKSYNKKLTVKAYRAAVALAAQLNN